MLALILCFPFCSVWVDGEEFAVVSSTQAFLVTLAEYCRLGQRLPSVLHELGLRVAEILKFYNSKICQLVLGVSGTIDFDSKYVVFFSKWI